jgi:hypothetical protein
MKLPLPRDFELYESTASARGANPVGVRRPLESKKSFQYVVIPRKEGKYEIPPVPFAYFDPEKKAYQTVQSSAIELTITENSNQAQGAGNNYLKPGTGAPAPVQEELRYLMTEGTGLPWGKLRNALLVALGLLNLALMGRVVRRKGTAWFEPLHRHDAFGEARDALAALKKSPGKDLLGELEEILFVVLQKVLSANPRGMTRSELESAWRAAGLPYDLFQKTGAFLDTLDKLRFGAGTKQEAAATHSKLFQDAEEIIGLAGKAKR